MHANRRLIFVVVAALALPGIALLGLVGVNALPQATTSNATVLIAAGDIADCQSDGDTATARLVATLPGTVVALGDNAYERGTTRDFADCYDTTWGAFKARTRPVPGNHDYETPSAAAYFRYFGSQAGDATGGYYVFTLGSWRIYALNSNCSDIGGCDPGSPEYEWLVADLKAHPADCVAAYWHHPRWSSGTHGNYRRMKPIWDLLYRNGADVVLNGHDHDYERFAPQDAAGRVDPAFGLREFVVGTGGKSHYRFRDPPLPTTQVRNDDTYGVLELTLDADSYKWRFVPAAGGTFTDGGTTPCHSAPPSTRAS